MKEVHGWQLHPYSLFIIIRNSKKAPLNPIIKHYNVLTIIMFYVSYKLYLLQTQRDTDTEKGKDIE